MADEPEDDDLGDLEVDTEACPDWFECENAYIVACRGWQDVQDHFGAPLIRITMKPANVEVLVSQDDGETWGWVAVNKFQRQATVTAIKGGKE